MAHTHTVGDMSGRKLLWTIVFNLAITAAEIVGGLFTGYLALLADAAHNLSDVAALVLAWIGLKGSSRPATKRSTYGLLRLEVMTALISAVSLVVIAVFIILAAFERLANPQPITQPSVYLTVAVIGLVGNVVSMVLLHSEKGKSLNMKAAFLHMTYDAVSSVTVIGAGVAIMLTGLVVIDVVLSVILGLMIFWSSYLVIKEAVIIFLEAVPDGIDFDAVLDAVGRVDGVTNVHDLHIWSLSSREVALSCHVCVEEATLPKAPEIVVAVNTILSKQFDIGHGTVQVELDECDRPDILCRTNNHAANNTDRQS
ncbi:MAG: cation diffusion facilitator family transporter [Candidatus Zixiibacteriota bacterium]